MTCVFTVRWSAGWTVHSTRALAESADFGYHKGRVEAVSCSSAALSFLIAIEQGVTQGRVQGRVPGLRLTLPNHFYLQDFAEPIPELAGITDPEAHETALIAFRDSAGVLGKVFAVGH